MHYMDFYKNKKLIEILNKEYNIKTLLGAAILSTEKDFKVILRIIHNQHPIKLTIFKSAQLSLENIKNRTESLKFLEENNFPSPRIIKTINNEDFIYRNEFGIYVTEYINGEKLNENSINYFDIGKYLMLLHSINIKDFQFESMNNIFAVTNKSINNLNERLNEIIPTQISHAKNILGILESFKDFKPIDKVFINGDLHLENFITDSFKKIILIDYDFAGVGSSLRDISDFTVNESIVSNFKDWFAPDKGLIELENSLFFKEKILIDFIKGYKKSRKEFQIEAGLIVRAMKHFAISNSVEDEINTINLRELAKYNFILRNEEIILKAIKIAVHRT